MAKKLTVGALKEFIDKLDPETEVCILSPEGKIMPADLISSTRETSADTTNPYRKLLICQHEFLMESTRKDFGAFMSTTTARTKTCPKCGADMEELDFGGWSCTDCKYFEPSKK